jgi:hypothetical protein
MITEDESMKKIIFIALALVLALSLFTACGSDDNDGGSTTTPPANSTTTAPPIGTPETTSNNNSGNDTAFTAGDGL